MGGVSLLGVACWGVSAQGVSLLGGVPAQGVPAQGVPAWGVPAQGVCLPRGISLPGGACLGVSLPGGVPCDLSHHAFDVTCMLPPHQLRPTNSAAAYIVLIGHVTYKASWDTHPPPSPCEQNRTHL